MNAQTTITEPRWAKYLPVVDAHLPARDDVERRHRANLMLLRDIARTTSADVSWEAAQALQAVATIAEAHALTDMPAGMLEQYRRAVTRLYLAAQQIDLVFEARGDG